jgi:hypothetical protein
MVGPAIASSDGYSPSTALSFTTAPTAIGISKNGSTFADRNSTQAVTAVKNGYYTVNLSTVDVGTPGRLRIQFYKSSTHIPFWEDFTVVSANVYNSLYGGSTYLQVDVQTIEGSDATNQLTTAAETGSQTIWDSTCEYSITNRQMLRGIGSVLLGISTGAGSTTLKFQAAGSSTQNRVTMECGSSGNRQAQTALTLTT